MKLNTDALEKLLCDPRIKDKPVAVLSIAGPFRSGKSFLLGFFLRFLYNLHIENWLGDPNEPVNGFKWRGGCERHTVGIKAWDEVFLVQTSSGQEIAVLLLDTQGMHDDRSTMSEIGNIFALSTMASSVQIYNVWTNIQENDLQSLEYFAEYGRLAQAQVQGKPFQKLQFLVRDWYHESDAPYGAEGGRMLLNKRLQASEDQPGELKQRRENIYSCFKELACFLMPHPGLKVAKEKASDVRLRDIEGAFRSQLLWLVPSLLSPDNLIVKEINNEKITCQQLSFYIKSYVNIFNGCELPRPVSVYQATAEANNWAAVMAALDTYRNTMRKLCGNTSVQERDIQRCHSEARRQALVMFSCTRKMGGEGFSAPYQITLMQEIDDCFEKSAPYLTRTSVTGKWLDVCWDKCVNTCLAAQIVSAGGLGSASIALGLTCSPVGAIVCGCFCLALTASVLGTATWKCIKNKKSRTRASYKPLKTEDDSWKGLSKKGVNRVGGTAVTVMKPEVVHGHQKMDVLNPRRSADGLEKGSAFSIVMNAMAEAKDMYKTEMEKTCEDEPDVNPEQLKKHHEYIRRRALERLLSICRESGMEPTQDVIGLFEQEIDEAFVDFANTNRSGGCCFGYLWAWLRRRRTDKNGYCRIKED